MSLSRSIMFVIYLAVGLFMGIAIERINYETNHVFGIGLVLYLLIMIMFTQYYGVGK